MKATPKKCKLIGVYRPRKKPPGFGIPVFTHRGHLMVQAISEDKVDGFLYCDLNLKELQDAPHTCIQSVGEQALYAFQHFDGNIWIGHWEHLRNKLIPLRHFFKKTPFVLEDIDDFLGYIA